MVVVVMVAAGMVFKMIVVENIVVVVMVFERVVVHRNGCHVGNKKIKHCYQWYITAYVALRRLKLFQSTKPGDRLGRGS